MVRLLTRAAQAALAAVLVFACSDADSVDVLLVVQAAQQQPSRDEDGIIVAIQSMGGRWLEIEVRGGSLVGSACLPAPVGSVLSAKVTNVIVLPTQSEAIITVRLLPDGAKATADDGAGAFAETGPCRLAVYPLKTVIRPIQRVSAATPMPGASGTGGGGGSAAAAGAEMGGVGAEGGSSGASDAGAGPGMAGTAGSDAGSAGADSGAGGA